MESFLVILPTVLDELGTTWVDGGPVYCLVYDVDIKPCFASSIAHSEWFANSWDWMTNRIQTCLTNMLSSGNKSIDGASLPQTTAPRSWGHFSTDLYTTTLHQYVYGTLLFIGSMLLTVAESDETFSKPKQALHLILRIQREYWGNYQTSLGVLKRILSKFNRTCHCKIPTLPAFRDEYQK